MEIALFLLQLTSGRKPSLYFEGRSADLNKLGDSMGDIKNQYYTTELPKDLRMASDIGVQASSNL